MRVVLNLTCINNTSSGARNRIKNLYHFLVYNNKNINFFILEPSDSNIQNLFVNCNNVEFIKTKCLSYNGFQRFIVGFLTLPKIIKKIKPHIYEQFHLPLIEIKNVKTIFTIHDIRYSSLLNSITRPRIISNFFIKRAIEKSSKVFSVSNAVKNDLIELTKGKNIKSIYNTTELYKFNKKHPGLNKYKFINEKYILSVGIFEDRKNYITIVEAAYLLKKLNYHLKFIIVGFKTKFFKKIIKKVNLLNLNESFIFLHNIADNDLLNLYKNTELFLFPSKYEGFGIPILEAVSQNCKILLSDIKVFKELTENKLSYFEKMSAEDLAYHIIQAIQNSSINDKQKYFLDKKILNNYSPQKVSNEILEIYKSCVA